METVFRLASLFCFTAATFGFLYFMAKYRRGSRPRLWGIRFCHGFGYLGLVMHRLWVGQVNEVTLLVAVALTVSTIGFELSEHYLR